MQENGTLVLPEESNQKVLDTGQKEDSSTEWEDASIDSEVVTVSYD